ncbi:DUF6588 family protein [Carboxylicivirga caseinilyticus]|uniref:DUF6588 family protein n=1 Tax=Carboxylicivirga caseinilyticus TaxID=3417572 RepID=UPI003D34C4F0|nr:hypothetical protein [Marinilabiliaceae bacterium A049]
MKKILTYILLSGLFVIGHKTEAQTQVVDYLNYGIDNAQVLSGLYLQPYAGMLNSTLIGGWNMSPRVLRPGRFNVQFFYNQSFSNGNKLLYIDQLIESNQLSGVSLENTNINTAPTAVYNYPGIQERPVLVYNETATMVPNGKEIKTLGLPLVSASVGISMNTDLSIRIAPPLKNTNIGEAFMWGIGLKHSLIPYFRFMQKHPFLEASLMGNYSQITTSSDIIYNDPSGQTLEMTGKNISGKFLMGAHFTVVDIYGSVGYSNRTIDSSFKGTYTDIPGETSSISDPITNNYDFSAMEYELGAQVRIYFFNLQTSYSYSDFGMISLGAGISF